MTRTRLAVAVAAVLVTAGCGGGGGSVTVKSSSSSSTSSSTSETTSSSPSSSSSTTTSSTQSSSTSDSSGASLPEGYKRATIDLAKISFGVPNIWVLVDPAKLDDTELEKTLEPMAKSSGTTASALAQQVKTSFSAMYFSPVAEDGFSENLNVNKRNFPKSGGLPTESELASSITQIGGKTESYAKRNSPAGEGVAYAYSLPTSKGITAHGTMIVVPNGTDGYSVITVSSGKAARTKTLTDAIFQSVETN